MAVDFNAQEESHFEKTQQRIRDLVLQHPDEIKVVSSTDGRTLEIEDVLWVKIESLSHTSHLLKIVIDEEKEEPK